MNPKSTRSNLPAGKLAWSLNRAAEEFNVASDVSLAAWLKDAGQSPDPVSGTWTTQQIVAVLFGDLHAQKVRRVREEADKVALQNAITRGEYLNKFELESLLSQSARAIVLIIESSALSRLEKDDIRRELGGIRVRVENIAAAQLRGLNGAASGNGAQEPARRKRGRPRKSAEAKAAVPADG